MRVRLEAAEDDSACAIVVVGECTGGLRSEERVRNTVILFGRRALKNCATRFAFELHIYLIGQ